MLVIPAAGLGSRLRSPLPKVLVPVLGRPMIDWLVELYRPCVERFVVVVNPASRTLVSEHLSRLAAPATVVVQESPTGMLDALLIARPIVEAGVAQQVWISWCDQVGVHPRTVARLADESVTAPNAALVMPTCARSEPYIHLERGPGNRIVRVLQRREGDRMPAVGESDMGLFSLSRRAFLDDLHAFASAASTGEATGERNFLPFIPWADARGGVRTFPCVDEQESIGVNTPDELSTIERYLQARARS
ncbi:MAG TPA: NTP transferase domain-containing protein [Vicinamibacterales bacterium]|nr:NTP transferase domain-containing protein [Vicinamibacterales bacterium]